MVDGYWINYRNGAVCTIDEHERWLRRWGNVLSLGLTPDEEAALGRLSEEYLPKVGRDCFLLEVMAILPMIRVRGHGNSCSFEFAAVDPVPALGCVQKFGREQGGFGDLTLVAVINFKGCRSLNMSWKEFKGLDAATAMQAATTFTLDKSIPARLAAALE